MHRQFSYSMDTPCDASLDRLHHLSCMGNLTIHAGLLEQAQPSSVFQKKIKIRTHRSIKETKANAKVKLGQSHSSVCRSVTPSSRTTQQESLQLSAFVAMMIINLWQRAGHHQRATPWSALEWNGPPNNYPSNYNIVLSRLIAELW